ncbi:MAG: ParB/RepB/Spo0J family partition protein [Actinobacteria bacterium]|nr:ParB/RepB/Spo0J family partition protein [Cyanobacteriota bacterium]MCL5772404.1 ParB/RepB/Spo0J family partition protein [Actinomycetota bacterium]
MAQRGLGRGLGALIPNLNKSPEVTENVENRVFELGIEQIEPNKKQPRRNFNEESLSELSDSIKEFGIIQPIIVRKLNGEEKYEIIAGERRFRAAKQAGLTSIPALINTNIDDTSSLAMALIENIHRENLSPIEQAHTYKQLLEELNITHEDLSKRIGKSRASITNLIRILNLPISVQKLIDEGKVTTGHAKVLVSLKKPEDQLQVAELIIKNDLSVREVEKIVNLKNNPPEKKQTDDIVKLTKLPDVSQKVSEYLNAPVKIIQGKKKGKIEIEFGSIGELERIVKSIIS